jgi:hypothetical protein
MGKKQGFDPRIISFQRLKEKGLEHFLRSKKGNVHAGTPLGWAAITSKKILPHASGY